MRKCEPLQMQIVISLVVVVLDGLNAKPHYVAQIGSVLRVLWYL